MMRNKVSGTFSGEWGAASEGIKSVKHRVLDSFGSLEFCLKVCYTFIMYNWSTDVRELKKNPEKYKVWQLEQLINFGLDGEKLKKPELKKYFSKLNIDPYRRKFLHLLLNGK